jgi:hypothetical protein
MHKDNRERVGFKGIRPDFLGEIILQRVQKEESCFSVVGLVIRVVQLELCHDDILDCFNRETSVALDAGDHLGLVLRVWDVGDGVHSCVHEVLPNAMFEHWKVAMAFELGGKSRLAEHMGLLRS